MTQYPFELEAFAPAKVNLGLRVTGIRDDGYHELDSVFVPLDFGDRLKLVVTPDDAPCVTIQVTGANDVPAGGDNLAARAAASFLEATGARWKVAILLEKQIPSGAGLGGGSSDAAAVLRVLADRADDPLAPERLANLALSLGADVPFFLDPQPARVRGIGDRIEPLPGVPALPLLLIHPGAPLATPEVYRAFDALVPDPTHEGRPEPGPWPVDPAELRQRLENDLEPAALRLCPALGRLRRQLEGLGALAVGMSGSGATLYAVFPNLDAASTAQAQGNFPWSRVASSGESR